MKHKEKKILILLLSCPPDHEPAPSYTTPKWTTLMFGIFLFSPLSLFSGSLLPMTSEMVRKTSVNRLISPREVALLPCMGVKSFR